VNKTSRHLYQKIDAHRGELEFTRFDLDEGARTLVVSYGTSARSMIEAARNARASGKHVSTLTVQSLFPMPEQSLRNAMRDVTRVIVPELNLGQYRLEVERLAATVDSRPQVIGVNRVDGGLIEPGEIEEQVL
jgi:2-oxoglutarate ferredoxin oxidoreductase subunit alpha